MDTQLTLEMEANATMDAVANVTMETMANLTTKPPLPDLNEMNRSVQITSELHTYRNRKYDSGVS